MHFSVFFKGQTATGRPRPLPPTARNHVWAYGGDFVFDTCANRQTLKCLTIVDEWTRECLAIDVAALVLEVKGDFCHDIRRMLTELGRADDYIELAGRAAPDARRF